MTPPDVILASRSAARSALLRGAGVSFEAADSGVDEAALKTAILAGGAGPAEVASALAREKALAVSRRGPGLVIGADQTLDFEGRLHDKPLSLAEAADRLRAMRGRAHRLHAAVAAARDGVVIWEALSSAELIMRSFSDAFLEAYLAGEGEEALSSVGAYRLEGPGVQLFSEIRGDYFTILGLPLTGLLELLRREGVLTP
ncbi:Maf family protein [Phenylobacterium sp.]|jgi:septum formation protein|uniref:Maf family protein n=1 Tax=Phenylobacterium sp. TaxID=1871053 RepID=UPI0025E99005|nr:Maf family protein [Phenylobacterium sp.]MCA6285560.1 Maf family protein [Phenylobacterium sp.]MCA6287907.1 Maf family protein [Phenylobacterium sp.]MCA6309423.1 Maf family protein [Phenylobacterium sp.]MCA6323176.1 Maf family protein [Phenylobacterium sp.]MCA6337400.1 Maf family protein [Phenylobacterium sp.]